MLLKKILRQRLVACLALALASTMGCVYDPERRADSEEAHIQGEQSPELPERPELRRGNIIVGGGGTGLGSGRQNTEVL